MVFPPASKDTKVSKLYSTLATEANSAEDTKAHIVVL